jgi:hypothetical protein
MSNVRRHVEKITVKRGVFMLALLPIVFFSVVTLLPPQRPRFSSTHRAEIQSIAYRICAHAAVLPCSITWGGKGKWFGTLPASGSRSVTSVEGLRSALPPPEWVYSPATQEHRLTDGRYVVSYVSASGSIVITSVD